MNITPGPVQGTLVDPRGGTTPKPVETRSVSTPAPSAAPVEASAQTESAASVSTLQRQTNVTLHQDASGRAYYVVSDARSGQEIIEVPPKTVRDVGEGIQEYLKQQESKAASRVDTKA